MSFDVTVLTQQYGVPMELTAALQAVQGNFSEDFGETFVRLSIKGFQFSTVSGGTSTPIPGSEQGLNCVILAESLHDHNTFYLSSYDGNSDASAPDAVWYEGDPIPETVPPAMRVRRQDGRLPWSRRRRIVIVPMSADGSPLNGMTPVVFDVGSMSLYGQDLANGMGMSYAHFRAWCKQRRVLPCIVPVRIVLDRTASVPSVRFVPMTDTNGRPAVFNGQALQLILETAQSEQVKSLVEVHRIPAEEVAPVAEQAAPAYGQAFAQPAPVAEPALAYGQAFAQPAPVAEPTPVFAQPVAEPVPVAPVAEPAPAVPVAEPAPAVPLAEPQLAPDAVLENARQEIAGMDTDLDALLQSATIPF